MAATPLTFVMSTHPGQPTTTTPATRMASAGASVQARQSNLIGEISAITEGTQDRPERGICALAQAFIYEYMFCWQGYCGGHPI